MIKSISINVDVSQSYLRGWLFIFQNENFVRKKQI